jgi:hypothetical protein
MTHDHPTGVYVKIRGERRRMRVVTAGRELMHDGRRVDTVIDFQEWCIWINPDIALPAWPYVLKQAMRMAAEYLAEQRRASAA